MFEERKKTLIIVAEEKYKHHAVLFKELFTSKDQVNGLTAEVAIWSAAHFSDNEPTISSSQKIIFMGPSKVTRSHIDALSIDRFKVFDEFGIQIHTSKNRCYISVNDVESPADGYDEFMSFCEEHNKIINERVLAQREVKEGDESKNSTWGWLKSRKREIAVVGFLVPTTRLPSAGYLLFTKIKGAIDNKKVLDQKYSVGSQIFNARFADGFISE